jgi:ubiquitin carboxyl-terminal hydrolase L3
MPLESNPEVINTYISKMGLKTELWNFTELLSTEDWGLEMVPKPVLGILMLYEETPAQNAFKDVEAAQLKP